VTLGALREAVNRGELGADDRVVLLVTGDGLKTPGLVADRLDLNVVAPDVDQILEELAIRGQAPVFRPEGVFVESQGPVPVTESTGGAA
jgi:threonine synthase